MSRDTARTSGSDLGVVKFDEKCGDESVLIVVKLVVVGMRASTSAIWAFSSLISEFFCRTRPARGCRTLSLSQTQQTYLLQPSVYVKHNKHISFSLQCESNKTNISPSVSVKQNKYMLFTSSAQDIYISLQCQSEKNKYISFSLQSQSNKTNISPTLFSLSPTKQIYLVHFVA